MCSKIIIIHFTLSESNTSKLTLSGKQFCINLNIAIVCHNVFVAKLITFQWHTFKYSSLAITRIKEPNVLLHFAKNFA